MSQVLRECAIGMQTAGLSIRAVSRESNVHDTNYLHPLVARKENVAGLKLIFCNYSHFVIGCREHCYIANLLAILYILPPCLMSIHVVFK
jgi:hypothetical protein